MQPQSDRVLVSQSDYDYLLTNYDARYFEKIGILPALVGLRATYYLLFAQDPDTAWREVVDEFVEVDTFRDTTETDAAFIDDWTRWVARNNDWPAVNPTDWRVIG